MRLVQRLLAPVGFAVVAFCYLLPFAAIRLDDPFLHLAHTFGGRDLVIGGKSRPHIEAVLEQHGPMVVLPPSEIPSYLGGDGVSVGAQPAFTVAFILVVAGLAAAILAGDRVRAVVSAVAGAGAAAAMGLGGWLFLHPDAGSPFEPSSIFRFVPAYGFWLALGLLVCLAVDGLVLSLRRGRPEPTL